MVSIYISIIMLFYHEVACSFSGIPVPAYESSIVVTLPFKTCLLGAHPPANKLDMASRSSGGLPRFSFVRNDLGRMETDHGFTPESVVGHATMARWRHQMETFSASLAICAGNHRSSVNSTHKGQWRGALMFSVICSWINGLVNNREAGDLRRHRPHYDVNATASGATPWSIPTVRNMGMFMYK